MHFHSTMIIRPHGAGSAIFAKSRIITQVVTLSRTFICAESSLLERIVKIMLKSEVVCFLGGLLTANNDL